MKLSKWLLFLFVFSLQLNMVFSEEEKADEEKSDKTEKGDKKKSVEFKLEGLITKNRKDAIILKTNMEEIILPPVPAGDTKMRYEDFLNKNVVLIGMGYKVPDKKNPNFPDRHKLKSVKEITLKE